MKFMLAAESYTNWTSLKWYMCFVFLLPLSFSSKVFNLCQPCVSASLITHAMEPLTLCLVHKGTKSQDWKRIWGILRENCSVLKSHSLRVEISFPGWWDCLNSPDAHKRFHWDKRCLGDTENWCLPPVLTMWEMEAKLVSCSLEKGSKKKEIKKDFYCNEMALHSQIWSG